MWRESNLKYRVFPLGESSRTPSELSLLIHVSFIAKKGWEYLRDFSFLCESGFSRTLFIFSLHLCSSKRFSFRSLFTQIHKIKPHRTKSESQKSKAGCFLYRATNLASILFVSKLLFKICRIYVNLGIF